MKNKYQEALDEFESVYRNVTFNLFDDLTNEKRDVLQELIDKETPMKPTHKEVANLAQDGFFPLVIGHCDKCGWEDLTELNSYCSNCGQRIDWGGGDE